MKFKDIKQVNISDLKKEYFRSKAKLGTEEEVRQKLNNGEQETLEICHYLLLCRKLKMSGHIK